MEIQIRELIDQIKKDGVNAAETEAMAILQEAEAKAEKIIADAKAEAEKLLAAAKADCERMVKSGEDAIRQAGRNLLISFRESVTRELGLILSENVSKLYSGEDFAKLVTDVILAWAKRPEASELSVVMNSADLEKLEKTVLSSLKDRISKGVTLRANDNFDGGFRVAVGEGGAYYDYSAEAVVDMLSSYLAPKVTKLLKEA